MSEKFNKGDEVLGPQYSRSLPIYTVIEAYHSPDGKSVYQIRVKGRKEDSTADQMVGEESLSPLGNITVGTYIAFGGTLYRMTDRGCADTVSISEIAPLITQLLNEHQSKQGG